MSRHEGLAPRSFFSFAAARWLTRGSFVALVVAAAACSSQASGPPAESSASAAPSARDLVATPPSAAPTPPSLPAAATSAPAVASAPPAASALPVGSATAAADETPPRGKVSNIGMHIGGGPNDDITKEPIRKSVQPHFDAFRRCFGQAKDAKTADVSIDLHIPREGGKAKVTKTRSTLRDEAFQACVVKTFDAIEFLKPRTGETNVSYSLRFTPLSAYG